ncbi:MAG: cell division protein ZapD [Betaproteobacteria bacterium]|nr:cell division protein ZapD [Betaproteobacteria bacterium]
MIRYEHPLNERIRTMMRLEDLFQRARYFSAKSEPNDHHAALNAMFEIAEIASRADLKSDLLQELERQRQLLSTLRENPQVAAETLDEFLSDIVAAAGDLHGQSGRIGQHLRDNEWLMIIKQRMGIPGGVCEFDLPSYHYWLNRDAASRQRDLQGWLAPFVPIDEALGIVLRVLRDSGRSSRQVAYNGLFQLMLTANKVAQLLRITVARDLPCVPEISANRYALNIRFVGFDIADRPRQMEQDVEFDLTFCNL